MNLVPKILLALLVLNYSCINSNKREYKTCNPYEIKKQTPNVKLIYDPPKTALIHLNLLYRAGHKAEPINFLPKDDTEHGIFYMNLIKSILNKTPFSVDLAKYNMSYCFENCPVLKQDSTDKFNYYTTNMNFKDSVFHLIRKMNWDANTMSNLNYETGCIIDILAGLHGADFNLEQYDLLYGLKPIFSDLSQIRDTNYISNQNQIFIMEINNRYSLIEKEKIKAPSNRLRVVRLEVRDQVTDSIFYSKNHNNLMNITSFADSIRSLIIE